MGNDCDYYNYGGALSGNFSLKVLNRHMIQKYTLKFTIDDIENIIVPDVESASSLCHELVGDNRLYTDKIVIRELRNIQ